MKRFAALYRELDASTGTDDKTDALCGYFRSAPPADAAWAVYFLTGQRLKRTLSTRALRSAAIEAAAIPPWLLEECYAAVGDFSETVSLLLPDPVNDSEEPLHITMQRRVLPLIGADEPTQRSILLDAWAALGAAERLAFHKIIRGGFRVGVQRRMVVRALAALSGLPAELIERRLVGGFEPLPERFAALMVPAGDAPVDDDRPYPFFLANPLQDPPESLGPVEQWLIEWKWDGIRAQALKRSGRITLWSRGEEIVTDQFPEIQSALAALPGDLVLDGEVLAWREDAAGGRPLPFADLQKRLNRKSAPTLQPGLFDTDRVVFAAFDILERDGTDLRQQPTRHRRQLLERLLDVPPDGIHLSPRVAVGTWEQVSQARAAARGRAAEGLMLKHLDSEYASGRSRLDAADGRPAGWWKWKVDPYSVDAVLVYAQPGSGRRAGLLTDYTFAVWDTAQSPPVLVPFTKAYSGLSNEEIERVDAWARGHTTAKTGPVRAVDPTLVFEIAFEAIAESDRHRAGLAVRFPRIARWRTDKSAEQADTLESLRRLLAVVRGSD